VLARFAEKVGDNQLCFLSSMASRPVPSDYQDEALKDAYRKAAAATYSNFTILRNRHVQEFAESDLDKWKSFLDRRFLYKLKIASSKGKQCANQYENFLRAGAKTETEASALVFHLAFHSYMLHVVQVIKSFLRLYKSKVLPDTESQLRKLEGEATSLTKSIEDKRKEIKTLEEDPLLASTKKKPTAPLWLNCKLPTAQVDTDALKKAVPYPDGQFNPLEHMNKLGPAFNKFSEHGVVKFARKLDCESDGYDVDADYKLWTSLCTLDTGAGVTVPDLASLDCNTIQAGDEFDLFPPLVSDHLKPINEAFAHSIASAKRTVRQLQQMNSQHETRAENLEKRLAAAREQLAVMQKAVSAAKTEADRKRAAAAVEANAEHDVDDDGAMEEFDHSFDGDRGGSDDSVGDPNRQRKKTRKQRITKKEVLFVVPSAAKQPLFSRHFEYGESSPHQAAKRKWESGQWTHTTQDVCDLIDPTKEFAEDMKGKMHLVFGDVPFGVLPTKPSYDVQFTEKQIGVILDGCKKVCHIEGTIVIRLGEYQKDTWRDVATQKGLWCEPMFRIIQYKPKWQCRKHYSNYAYFSTTGAVYYLIIHKRPPFGAMKKSWFESKVLFGAHTPLSKNTQSQIWSDNPHVSNAFKLLDDQERVLRVPENHIKEMCELIQRYCPPSGQVLDFCSGTGTTALAAMHLNRKCHINDRDEDCMAYAISRCKHFLLWLYEQRGCTFPGLHTAVNTKDDGTDIYKAFVQSKDPKYARHSDRHQSVPVTNEMTGFPTDPNDVVKFNEANGVLVQESEALVNAGVTERTVGLHAIRRFEAGEKIISMWGRYVVRLHENSIDNSLRLMNDVPSNSDLFMLTNDPRNAAGYINDPSLHESTRQIEPNCEMIETDAPLDDNGKVVVYALKAIEGTKEDPVELWFSYAATHVPGKGRQRNANQRSKRYKGVDKRGEENGGEGDSDTRPKPKRRRVGRVVKGKQNASEDSEEDSGADSGANSGANSGAEHSTEESDDSNYLPS
jgi:hypothetical protein